MKWNFTEKKYFGLCNATIVLYAVGLATQYSPETTLQSTEIMVMITFFELCRDSRNMIWQFKEIPASEI